MARWTIGPSTYSLHWNSLSWNWGCKNLSYYPLLGWIKWNITKDMIWVGLGGPPPSPPFLPPLSLKAFELLPGWTWTTSGLCFLYMKMQPIRVGSEQAINEIHFTPPSQISCIFTYFLTSPLFWAKFCTNEKNKNISVTYYSFSKFRKKKIFEKKKKFSHISTQLLVWWHFYFFQCSLFLIHRF